MRRFSICLAIFVVCGLSGLVLADGAPKPPEIVKVFTKDARAILGEVKSEKGSMLTVLRLDNGAEETVDLSDAISVERNLTDDQAVKASDLPTVVAWKIKHLLRDSKPAGKVAKVTDAVVYTTLGSDRGVSEGDPLIAYRPGNAVKDPDTGQILTTERTRLADLQVIEVHDNYCKAKLTGNTEVQLQVGDDVEMSSAKLEIAVFPPTDDAGNTTESGNAINEQLTTKLVDNRIPVVERARLDATLTELALQHTPLFDPATAVKCGKAIGASAVLTGTIVAKDAEHCEAHIRLIDVATQQIIMAVSAPLTGAAPRGGLAPAPQDDTPHIEAAPLPSGTTQAGPAIGQPPTDDRIVAEDEHKGTIGGWALPRDNVYKLTIPPTQPKARLGYAIVSFHMVFPGDVITNRQTGRMHISVDYGKTWIEAYDFDTAAVMQGRRNGDWYHVRLWTAGAGHAAHRAIQAADGYLDEIQVKFGMDYGSEAHITDVIWSDYTRTPPSAPQVMAEPAPVNSPAPAAPVVNNVPPTSQPSAPVATPTTASTLVTNAKLLPGITANIYSGMHFETLIATRTDSTINFVWAREEPPAPGVSTPKYSIRWTGVIVVPDGGATLSPDADDGARITIDGKPVFDSRGKTHHSFRISSGRHLIVIEYFNKLGGGRMILSWSADQMAQEVVPASALFHIEG